MKDFTIKRNLKEVDDIFKLDIEPTINAKLKYWILTIFVSATYSWKTKNPSSYTVSVKNSDKYHYKCYTKTEAKEKVREILKNEGFKDKKVKTSDNYHLDKINWLYDQKIPDLSEEKTIVDTIKDKSKRKDEIIEKIKKKYWIKDVYDDIWDFLDKLEFSFISENDKSFKDEEDLFIEWIYGSQSFWGITDYKDHRKDTKEKLIKLVKEQMPKYTKRLQIIHFINFNKWDFYNTIMLTWQRWGWNAKFYQ